MSQNPLETAFPPTDTSLLGAAHVKAYVESDGEVGYIWNGVTILLLTTTGRSSGEPRTIPIIFTEYHGSYVIIASSGGAPMHPKWYLNILAEPHVKLQVKAETFDAVARTADSPEREAIWREAVKNWPKYDLYQSRTTRQIPVVVIDRKP
ncbi:nitroreductase family deazaflavin-dependent oxidoreductase [Acidocella sp.]|uniref:nitroreductase family deazaflavin-dependent oxidoreductase n=1 Tax=Acidocella sp. TaxID=50710 RepID=UPI002608C6DD|nr:nitroreductase family deazaflavin-dependent oxidoreductase [Acidocella sp.]